MIAQLVLGVFWAVLGARLVQAEAIPGDRQFWTTRPYAWRSLLGAKLLFLAVFLSVPLLIADAMILRMEGFPIVAHLPGLFCSVTLTTVGLLMTIVAFATLTRGFTQFVLSAILTIGALIWLAEIGKGNVWGGVEWMRDCGTIAIFFVTASRCCFCSIQRAGSIPRCS
jgi:hypothetical protein